jgi:hypothetical protein
MVGFREMNKKSTLMADIARKQHSARCKISRRRARPTFVKRLGRESVEIARSMNLVQTDEFEKFVRQNDVAYDAACRMVESAQVEALKLIAQAKEEAEKIISQAKKVAESLLLHDTEDEDGLPYFIGYNSLKNANSVQ